MTVAIRVVNVRGIKGEARDGVCYVGRLWAGWLAHPLGNPFKPESVGAGGACQQTTELRRQKFLADCLNKYRAYLATMPDLEERLAALWEECDRGAKPLGCWCTDATAGDGSPCVCHAQVLAEMLRERFDGGTA